ncbi:unannotated protein [freshwater metagenome]|uniref:Unannotated protein n=1 Tax=freshwater metagenome TaxID=449393 RepID=A0A6J6EC91_9ZZZZ
MVEEDAVRGEHAIALTIVLGHPVGIQLCGTVGGARIERCVLVLRRRGGTKHLGTRRLVELGGDPHHSDCFQKSNTSKPRGVPGVFWLVKTDPNV